MSVDVIHLKRRCSASGADTELQIQEQAFA